MTDEPTSNPESTPVPEPTPVSDPAPTPESTSSSEPAAVPQVESAPVAAEVPAPVLAAGTEPSASTAPVHSYYWGTGRRKTSVARVRVKPGQGAFVVNKREVDEFFRIDRDRAAVRKPLDVTDTGKLYDVFVNVHGGGFTGQTGAVVLGLARALVAANPDCEAKLREHNLLTRDPRKVERKKYGRRGARRRFQFSKR